MIAIIVEFIYWLKIQKIARKYSPRDLTNSWELHSLKYLFAGWISLHNPDTIHSTPSELLFYSFCPSVSFTHCYSHWSPPDFSKRPILKTSRSIPVSRSPKGFNVNNHWCNQWTSQNSRVSTLSGLNLIWYQFGDSIQFLQNCCFALSFLKWVLLTVIRIKVLRTFQRD